MQQLKTASNTVEPVISFIQSNIFKNAEDLIYDSNIAKDVIIKWMQHIMRFWQKNKAKVDALAMLNESTALWIPDYFQKALLIKSREGEFPYFGEKSMMLHVDDFWWSHRHIVKVTNFTLA